MLHYPMRLTILFAWFFASSSLAQGVVTYHISSGTGFVINNDGHVVTNNHVVQACKSISVLTIRGEQPATLVARDETQDLAVLKTSYVPQRYAPLRWNISDLRVGDAILMLGFPGNEGAMGKAQFRKSEVTALTGPGGEPQLLQLRNVAAKGNSGGPVLDASGNVIGVITAIAMVYNADANHQAVGEPIRQSDVVITLAALRDFLQAHGIGFYETGSSNVGSGEATVLDTAQHFTVAIRCVQDMVRQ